MSDIEKDALDRLANDQSQLRVLQQGEQCRQSRTSAELTAAPRQKRLRWAVGILNDKEVEEVPGTLLQSPELLSMVFHADRLIP